MLLGLADALLALASPWLVSAVRLGFNTAVGILVVAVLALLTLLVIGFARVKRRAAWLLIFAPMVLFWPVATGLALLSCARTLCKMY